MQIGFDNVDRVFAHHAPKTAMDAGNHAAIRAAAREFAKAILTHVPNCADRTAAIRHVREAMFLANAAIALEGLI